MKNNVSFWHFARNYSTVLSQQNQLKECDRIISEKDTEIKRLQLLKQPDLKPFFKEGEEVHGFKIISISEKTPHQRMIRNIFSHLPTIILVFLRGGIPRSSDFNFRKTGDDYQSKYWYTVQKNESENFDKQYELSERNLIRELLKNSKPMKQAKKFQK